MSEKALQQPEFKDNLILALFNRVSIAIDNRTATLRGSSLEKATISMALSGISNRAILALRNKDLEAMQVCLLDTTRL